MWVTLNGLCAPRDSSNRFPYRLLFHIAFFVYLPLFCLDPFVYLFLSCPFCRFVLLSVSFSFVSTRPA